ncbi:MAG: DUF512 domain-containing protein, partial [Acidimicrobiia bacterium]
EPDMRVHRPGEAEAVVSVCERWQGRFLDVLGRRMVFVADEYYLMAGAAFPGSEEYEGFPQHENGIGMARMFEVEVGAALAGVSAETSLGAGDVPHRGGFFAWVDGAPADGYRSPRRTGAVSLAVAGELCSGNDLHGRSGSTEFPSPADVALLTGEYGARVLAPLLPALSEAAGADVRTLPVPNRLFGGNIAVTGLMTGADLGPVLAEAPAGRRYLLPDSTLSRDLFLDGTSPAALPRPVEVVATDGRALVAALRGPS